MQLWLCYIGPRRCDVSATSYLLSARKNERSVTCKQQELATNSMGSAPQLTKDMLTTQGQSLEKREAEVVETPCIAKLWYAIYRRQYSPPRFARQRAQGFQQMTAAMKPPFTSACQLRSDIGACMWAKACTGNLMKWC